MTAPRKPLVVHASRLVEFAGQEWIAEDQFRLIPGAPDPYLGLLIDVDDTVYELASRHEGRRPGQQVLAYWWLLPIESSMFVPDSPPEEVPC